jgi:hypothetical protein
VVTTLVLYKTLINNAEVYGKWAELYKWARGLVKEQEFTVTTSDIKRPRGAHNGLEEVTEEVRRELNAVLALYASHSRELYEKLRPHLEVDVEKAEELAEARVKELSKYSNANMGTKAYAALLSVARGGMYGHAAMLLMIEGALADIVLLTPKSAYEKADRIAGARGEAVDPSRSRRRAKAGEVAGGRGGAVDPSHVEAASWEDRAASVLLRYLLGRTISEDLVFRRVERGFEVFRAYGGEETRVDELKIGEVALSKAGEEELRRFVEEAKKKAPNLSGVKKIWQALEWLNTDVSFDRGWIEAATAHTWQAAWYIALFGEPESIGGGASFTEEGVKPNVTMRWRREVLDRIIAEEGEELKPLLGPVSKQGGVSREAEGSAVKSWRELVDAINWSQVLERVGELAGELKPWIGREDTDDVEREGLVRKMLGELALLAHFAEARRGKSDDEWREERVKRLTKAVEELSGGRIAGEYAERLAGLIIYYAERRDEKTKKRIESLAKEVGVSWEEVWSVVDFVLSDMYCLARDCADDRIVRKFVAPALELIMLDKALNNKFDREKALLRFGEMYGTAVAGDGSVGPDVVVLTVGGELDGGAALLRLAALYLLSQLLPDGLKFGVRAYVRNGSRYDITAYGENAAGLRRHLAVSAPSAGGEYLSDKFEEFVEEARVEVRVDNIRLTESGYIAADLTISEAGAAVKYNVYLRDDAMVLEFHSTDRSRVELAALLLKLAGIRVEVKKEGGRDEWYVRATTDMLAAGREELRKALAEIVKTARKSVGEEKAKRWLEKLEEGLTLMEGWPKYHVGLSSSGGLMVRFASPNLDSIKQEAQRLEKMGLKRGDHFTVKMPDGGEAGYVNILKAGLVRLAWLSENGKGEQQKLAAEFVKHILRRAEKAGDDVHEKAKKIVEEGKARSSLTLEGFERVVDGRLVRVLGGGAEFDEGRSGKNLLRIKITAEVDGVRSEYEITFGRYGRNNAARGRAYARADAPGGREADAERLAAVIEALTGRKPRIYRRKDGQIEIVCYEGHLEGFRRFAELADAIEKWLNSR